MPGRGTQPVHQNGQQHRINIDTTCTIGSHHGECQSGGSKIWNHFCSFCRRWPSGRCMGQITHFINRNSSGSIYIKGIGYEEWQKRCGSCVKMDHYLFFQQRTIKHVEHEDQWSAFYYQEDVKYGRSPPDNMLSTVGWELTSLIKSDLTGKQASKDRSTSRQAYGWVSLASDIGEPVFHIAV